MKTIYHRSRVVVDIVVLSAHQESGATLEQAIEDHKERAIGLIKSKLQCPAVVEVAELGNYSDGFVELGTPQACTEAWDLLYAKRQSWLEAEDPKSEAAAWAEWEDALSEAVALARVNREFFRALLLEKHEKQPT